MQEEPTDLFRAVLWQCNTAPRLYDLRIQIGAQHESDWKREVVERARELFDTHAHLRGSPLRGHRRRVDRLLVQSKGPWRVQWYARL